MADWDADGPQLRRNLTNVLASVRDDAHRRVVPTVAGARAWQRLTMERLAVPDPVYVGRFRGERGLEACEVRIGRARGVPAADVMAQLGVFEATLRRAAAALDEAFPVGADLDEDGLAAVIDLAAWAHSEWVRIHPFANGNGRTARIWANSILMRYGIPPAIRLRPRPEDGYGSACESAMKGDWQPTAAVFRRMVRDAASLV